jgi:hypothetical protein
MAVPVHDRTARAARTRDEESLDEGRRVAGVASELPSVRTVSGREWPCTALRGALHRFAGVSLPEARSRGSITRLDHAGGETAAVSRHDRAVDGERGPGVSS